MLCFTSTIRNITSRQITRPDRFCLFMQYVSHNFWKLFINIILGLHVGTTNALPRIDQKHHPITSHSINTLPLLFEHRINLEQAINMLLKTEIGQKFKADISELAGQGKIRLTSLTGSHYGESGEGCIIQNGQYFYEGMFILLNKNQSIPELASSLIHETDHYRQIKRINQDKQVMSISIGKLEISAFAVQYEFINQLEALGLANKKTMFLKEHQKIFEMMAASYVARNLANKSSYSLATNKIVEYGYPIQELKRTLIVREADSCKGPAKL